MTSWHFILNGGIWWLKMEGMASNLPCRSTTYIGIGTGGATGAMVPSLFSQNYS